MVTFGGGLVRIVRVMLSVQTKIEIQGCVVCVCVVCVITFYYSEGTQIQMSVIFKKK